MAVDKDQRKCCLVLLLFVYNIVVCLPDSVQAAESDTESGIVERVSRRQFRDVYFFINSSTIGTNCGDKNTYLISEERCVKDEELFGGNLIDFEPYTITIITCHSAGCSEAIIPTSSLHLTTILLSVLDRSSANVTHLLTGAANGTTYIETFKFNETSQLVNSSLCDISSLEVYRGRDQAIEISYQGFSLSDNGSIKVCLHTKYLYTVTHLEQLL